MVIVDMTVTVPLTKEEFDAVYVMWTCGARSKDLAEAYGIPWYPVDWCLVQRFAGVLDKYTVHFKDSN